MASSKNICTLAWIANALSAEDIDLTLATLDEPQRLAPAMHVWVQDKLPWLSIDDGLPQYPGGAPGG